MADAVEMRIAVVRSIFNAPVTAGLLEGALAALEEAGATEIRVVDVPGAFELPLAARVLADRGYDAVIALGAVILGETDHYEHFARQTSGGSHAGDARHRCAGHFRRAHSAR